MRFVAPVSFLALVALALAEEASPSDVLSLTASTFESTVNAEPLILVEFFAPWCGHCKALAPHYEEAATALKEKNIKIAKVDCVDEADLCQSKGIQGYPTLKVYRNGEATDYNGPRKADGIISYMVKQSLPAVSEVTAANLSEFQKADKIVAIAYLSSPTDAPAAEFSATAEAHRDDYLFGLTTDKDAIEAAGITPPAVIVYRAFDEPKSAYPYPISSLTKSDLQDWIKELAVPIIDEVSGENYAIYAASPKPLAYLFLDPSLEDKEAHIAAIKPIAAKYKSKMNFVWIDAIKFGDHAKALNLVEAKWPAFVIQDLEKQLKYPFDQNIDVTPKGAEEWVAQYLAGELQPQLKSQPIPESQDESVFTLVGKNFEEVVFDDEKDVFVEFYASWCGHCKRLKPTWDNLGEKYAPIKDRIVIAKMEAPENDLPPSIPFRIAGFPTLKFKPAGSKNFIDYEGDRSFESLVSFVEEHAKNSLIIPTEADDAQTPVEALNVTDSETRHDEL
ncbi:protein disulfide isomerase [Pholiota conissans]|uniref:Protein disulfide-isomerase n=1 Tax=Pholiota conissans TaxID=109636 RepID=A0A9P5ZG69_9AGAR|nr:protein disulfide isomerase [Pholiota conissans]